MRGYLGNQGRNRPNKRGRGGPLKKRAGLLVDRLADEVVRAGVADLELDCRVQLDELDQVRGPRRRGIFRRALRGG